MNDIDNFFSINPFWRVGVSNVNMNLALYFVTEDGKPIDQLLRTAEEAVKGGVTIVQLREKSCDSLTFYQKARRLKDMLDHYHVPLMINDRVDIALAINAAGVHIGQEDIPLQAVRKIVPQSMMVGVSAATVEEALEAEAAGANYLGVGSAFPTYTKKDATALPPGMLEEITSAVSIPTVAIGGITLDNVSLLKDTGIDGVAVISAISRADDPLHASQAFHKKLKGVLSR